VWPTIRVLPDVVKAVGDRTQVLLDGGIRRGGDVVKALCLGARAVLIGRAYAYGLATSGAEGVGPLTRHPARRHAPHDEVAGMPGSDGTEPVLRQLRQVVTDVNRLQADPVARGDLTEDRVRNRAAGLGMPGADIGFEPANAGVDPRQHVR